MLSSHTCPAKKTQTAAATKKCTQQKLRFFFNHQQQQKFFPNKQSVCFVLRVCFSRIVLEVNQPSLSTKLILLLARSRSGNQSTNLRAYKSVSICHPKANKLLFLSSPPYLYLQDLMLPSAVPLLGNTRSYLITEVEPR